MRQDTQNCHARKRATLKIRKGILDVSSFKNVITHFLNDPINHSQITATSSR